MILFEVIRDFLETGGQVLVGILFVTIILWSFILERFMYYRFELPELRSEVRDQWNKYKGTSRWQDHAIREMLVSQTSQKLNASIPFIKTLVALCPLLGLLGTVSGMISVFDVMAVTGTGNARLMASGISMATIPTMAGMVAALSGLYFGSLLQERAKKETEKIKDELTL